MREGGGDGGRPDRTGQVVGAVVLLLAVGALGLAWGTRYQLSDQTVRPDLSLLVTVFMGIAFVGAIVLWAMYGRPGPGGPQQRRRRKSMLGLLVLACVGFLLYRFGAGDGRKPPSWGEPPPFPEGGQRAETEPYEAAGGSALLYIGVFALAVLFAVAVVWWFARRRQPGELPAVHAERFREVISAGRSALADVADQRAAVIAAYVAMESALERAGLTKGRADTPTGMLDRADRVGLFGPVARAAAVELTELFELARFSERELPADSRERAESALGRIGAELDAFITAADSDREGNAGIGGAGDRTGNASAGDR